MKLPAANLIPAQPEHIEAVSRNARKKDVEEIYAAGGWTVKDCLEWGLKNSLFVSTILHNETPVAILGVTPFGNAGVPWMVATDGVSNMPLRFMKISKHYIHTVAEIFPALFNYVDERHNESIRYLKAVGFTVHEPEPYGFLGLPFRRFELNV